MAQEGEDGQGVWKYGPEQGAGDTVQTATGGCRRGEFRMGEGLKERRRVREEGIRGVNRLCLGAVAMRVPEE